MALDMDAMAPWHQLMLRVWSLSSLLRQAGLVLAETERSSGPLPAQGGDGPHGAWGL
jgi:hypothetical protein